MSVSCRLSRLKLQRQAKVGDAGSQVVLQQHVLTFNVPKDPKPQSAEKKEVLSKPQNTCCCVVDL